MPHPLSADLGASNFDPAPVTDNAPIPNTLVLATKALPVLGGTKEPFAEKAVFFRAKGAVVDGLRLGHLAVRPVHNLFWRRDRDPDRVEIGALGFSPVCQSDH
jgi:hypothetical protein